MALHLFFAFFFVCNTITNGRAALQYIYNTSSVSISITPTSMIMTYSYVGDNTVFQSWCDSWIVLNSQTYVSTNMLLKEGLLSGKFATFTIPSRILTSPTLVVALDKSIHKILPFETGEKSVSLSFFPFSRFSAFRIIIS